MARELAAKIREGKGRHAARRLRYDAQIPAVIYREGKVGTNLSVALNEWQKVLASGQRVVTLKMEGGDRQAIIKDVQYDNFGDTTLHIDFNELREGEKVTVAVTIVLKGVPKGVADGGVLNQPMHTIHVECLPNQIPDRIVIDVENMKLDDIIHVKEIKLPEGVKAVDDPDQAVVSVHEHKEEVVAEPVDGAPTEPEVLTAKKEEVTEGGPPPKKDDKKK